MNTNQYQYEYNVCGPTPPGTFPSQCNGQVHSAAAYRTKYTGPSGPAEADPVPADYCKAMSEARPPVLRASRPEGDGPESPR